MRGNNVGDDAGDVVDGAHGAGGLKLKIFEVLYEWDGGGRWGGCPEGVEKSRGRRNDEERTPIVRPSIGDARDPLCCVCAVNYTRYYTVFECVFIESKFHGLCPGNKVHSLLYNMGMAMLVAVAWRWEAHQHCSTEIV